MEQRGRQGVAELPVALLARVLQLVPQSDRLCSCALVCHDWAAAAALATVRIRHRFNSMPAFQGWLANHGKHLLSLESSNMYGAAPLLLVTGQLPQLQHLQLKYGEILLPDGTSAGPSAALADVSGSSIGTPLLPKLQHLGLPNATLPSPDTLLQMVQGPQLTSLDLMLVKFEALPEDWNAPMQEADRAKLRAGMAALLQRLPELVILNLEHVDVGPDGAKQLSAMTCLQDLTLQLYSGIDSSTPLGLSASITKLDLRDFRKEHAEIHAPISRPGLPQRLQQLTALQHLNLDWCALAPTMLEDFTHLQHLELVACALLPAGLDDEYHVEGTAALLSALSKMTRLQHLRLDIPDLDTVSQPLTSYAAITASSQLTELHLRPECEVQPLPSGAVQHMFPAGKRMPLLRELSIKAWIDDTEVSQPPVWHAVDSQDLACIISCCPNLQDLDISGVMPEGSDFSALLQLPSSCTNLKIGGWGFTDAAAVVIAQLTQLKHLDWWSSPGLTDSGLVQLTALGALTNLDILDCKGLSRELQTDGWGVIELENREYKPPVCMQLEDLCARSPVLTQLLRRPAEGIVEA